MFMQMLFIAGFMHNHNDQIVKNLSPPKQKNISSCLFYLRKSDWWVLKMSFFGSFNTRNAIVLSIDWLF